MILLSSLSQLALPLLALLSLLPSTLSADSKPDLSHTLFDNLPSKIFYFDDTSVSQSHQEHRSRGRLGKAEGRRAKWGWSAGEGRVTWLSCGSGGGVGSVGWVWAPPREGVACDLPVIGTKTTLKTA